MYQNTAQSQVNDGRTKMQETWKKITEREFFNSKLSKNIMSKEEKVNQNK